MSDYGYALSSIVRNWVTLLIYVLAVMMVAFAALQLMLLGLGTAMGRAAPGQGEQVRDFLESSALLSPLWPALLVTAIVGAGIALAYWLSIPLPFSRLTRGEETGKGRRIVGIAVLLLLLLTLTTIGLQIGGILPPDLTTQAWGYGVTLGLLSLLLSAAATWALLRKKARKDPHSTTRVDFRREQTRLLTRFNGLFLILLVVTVIDWGALTLRRYFDEDGALLSASVISSALVSVTSFLVAKLPDWLGGDGSKFRSFLVGHARQGAFVAAIVILASMALLADMLVLKLLWRGTAWSPSSLLEWHVFGPVLGLVVLIVIAFGRSLNFVNLLGLTPFYGARLSRAYLGASNARRLDTSHASEITEGLMGDDIALTEYMKGGGPAPIHLINVTRNRTVGDQKIQDRIDVSHDDPLIREDLGDPRGRLPSYESSLTLHDRHGDRVVFGPFGVRVGAEFFPLEDLKDPPSLGLLCAISGAAVGSGMGRMTSLSTAMALTLANVRLGYWWKAQVRQRPPSPQKATAIERQRALGQRMWRFVARKGQKRTAKSSRDPFLPGLACLSAELLGRFSTSRYWHLSDGGHSENSGALTLLERGCRFMLVADNAQDAAYQFGDLEIFIRTARTDIGMEVSVVAEKDFLPSLRAVKECFFNGSAGDWREKARQDNNNKAFALLLKAADIPHRANGVWRRRHPGQTWIVWLKPNRFAGLPADLATYAELNPDYPQQSTANQFFDEAQWESYRRLGFEMGRRLFAKPDTLADFLPIIYRD